MYKKIISKLEFTEKIPQSKLTHHPLLLTLFNCLSPWMFDVTVLYGY